ncbi:MAG: phytanoyl-CoA dioxygenase family protein [Elsteraceae bacterium]
MLSKTELTAYEANGYVTPSHLVPAAMVEEIRARHAKLVEIHPRFRDYCPALLDYDPGFLEYCREPTILDMVGQVLGPDFALWNTSFFAKPAHDGKATPWHQDGEYWPIRPLATCTVWLALDDATPENGCLRVIRGSHVDRRLRRHQRNDNPDYTLNQELDPVELEGATIDDIVLKPGQFSLHDVFLLHGSEANRSPRSRRGMTMRFMPTTSLFDRAVAREQTERMGTYDHSRRPLHLMRGVDRHGGNEFSSAL